MVPLWSMDRVQIKTFLITIYVNEIELLTIKISILKIIIQLKTTKLTHFQRIGDDVSKQKNTGGQIHCKLFELFEPMTQVGSIVVST